MASSPSFVLSAVVVVALFCVASAFSDCQEQQNCYWDHGQTAYVAKLSSCVEGAIVFPFFVHPVCPQLLFHQDLSFSLRRSYENVGTFGECCYYCNRHPTCDRWSYDTETRNCYLTMPWVQDWKHNGKQGWWCGRNHRYVGEEEQPANGMPELVENYSSARKFGKL
ncbi:hypothetical protein BSKO_02427 [Bryopsis sp. KO-2023]|nr:hypothetical protein BSKO_02427 [Bryopsis sp. KO-2023]